MIISNTASLCEMRIKLFRWLPWIGFSFECYSYCNDIINFIGYYFFIFNGVWSQYALCFFCDRLWIKSDLRAWQTRASLMPNQSYLSTLFLTRQTIRCPSLTVVLAWPRLVRWNSSWYSFWSGCLIFGLSYFDQCFVLLTISN